VIDIMLTCSVIANRPIDLHINFFSQYEWEVSDCEFWVFTVTAQLT